MDLINPSALDWLETNDKYHPRNTLNGNADKFFSLKGGTPDGWWMAEFTIKSIRVKEVKILSTKDFPNEASNAKVFVGDNLCGTLPADLEVS